MFDIVDSEVTLSCSGEQFSVRSENAVAKVVCAAVNALLRAPLEGASIVTKYRVPEGATWSRDTRDTFRRLMDRVIVRMDPPIDTRCIAHPQWLSFDDENHLAELVLSPNRCGIYLPTSCSQFTLEGIAYFFDESTATTPFRPAGEDKERKRLAWAIAQQIGCEWLLPQISDLDESKPLPPTHRRADVPIQTPDVFAFVMSAPATQKSGAPQRAVHMEPRGLSLHVQVVAVTDTKAVIAVRSQHTSSGLEIVGQIPIPSSLRKFAEAAIDTGAKLQAARKRFRDDANPCGMTVASHGALTAVFLAEGRTHHCVVPLLEDEQHVVEIKAYRVHVSAPLAARPDESCLSLVVEFDDAVAVSHSVALRKQPETVCAQKSDVVALIRSSCKEALRLSESLKSEGLKVGTVAQRLRKSLLDTTAATFTKDKKNAKTAQRCLDTEYPLQPHAAKAAVSEDFSLRVDETAMIEFKAKAGDWEYGAIVGSGNRERLRHALAAFANTFGGFLVIGVRDDGRVIGVGDEEAQVRTSGFCPTLYSGAIEHVLHKVKASGAVAAMPTDWWRAPTGGAVAAAAPSAVTKGAQRVISVYRVFPGSAPFYAPSKYTVPSTRGFCSTLKMPLRVCCSRIEKMIPLSSEKHVATGGLSAAALASVGLTMEATVASSVAASDITSA